jgi:hypothetical protein
MALTMLILDQGEGIMLSDHLNKTVPQNLVLRLFKNNYTPVDGSTEANFVEADFTGYTGKTLAGASWVVTPGAPTEAAFALQEFASTADQTTQNIYGAYLAQISSGKAIAAGRFSDAPSPITNNGDKIQITPKVQLKKLGE